MTRTMNNRLSTSIHINEKDVQALLSAFPKGIAAFDLEMTGLSAVVDKIIEIAAVKVDANGMVSTYHQMVNPLVEIPERTIQYHGITNEMVREMPALRNPLKEFHSFFGDLPLVAHNAQFDTSFIVRGMHEHNLPFSLSDVYDSCKMARAWYKKAENPPENFKLSTLADFYQLDFKHHQALDDAAVCLKIMANCIREIDREKPLPKVREMSFLYKLNSFQKPEAYMLTKKLAPLAEFAALKQEVDIMYQGGSFKNQFRPVKPVALLPMPQGLALYGLCMKSNTFKYFKVKKIKDFKAADKESNEC